jgi:hypothetical protein
MEPTGFAGGSPSDPLGGLMNSAIAALLGTVLGGAISFIGTIAVQSRQHAAERRRLLLGKLEECYRIGMDVRDAYRIAWGRMVGRLAGDTEQLTDLKKVEMDQLRMLVEIYFPTLESKIDPLQTHANEFGTVLGESLQEADRSPRGGAAMQEPLYSAFTSLEDSCTDFLKSVSVLSNQYLR